MNQDLNTTGHNPDDISVNGNMVSYRGLSAPRYDSLLKSVGEWKESTRGDDITASILLAEEFYTHAPLNLLLARLFHTDGAIQNLMEFSKHFKAPLTYNPNKQLIDYMNGLLMEANPEIDKRYDGLRLASETLNEFSYLSAPKIRYWYNSGSNTLCADICHSGKEKGGYMNAADFYTDQYQIDMITGKMTYERTLFVPKDSPTNPNLDDRIVLTDQPEVYDPMKNIHTDIATRTSNLLN